MSKFKPFGKKSGFLSFVRGEGGARGVEESGEEKLIFIILFTPEI